MQQVSGTVGVRSDCRYKVLDMDTMCPSTCPEGNERGKEENERKYPAKRDRGGSDSNEVSAAHRSMPLADIEKERLSLRAK